MFQRTIKGKKVRIRNCDYVKLLDRFTCPVEPQANAIGIECPLCIRYAGPCNCKGCPFALFRISGAFCGCSEVIEHFIGRKRASYLKICEEYIFWATKHNRAARNALTIIRTELLLFKKVK